MNNMHQDLSVELSAAETTARSKPCRNRRQLLSQCLGAASMMILSGIMLSGCGDLSNTAQHTTAEQGSAHKEYTMTIGKTVKAHAESFGALDDGRAVEAVVLSSGNGVTARIVTLGATLQSYRAPDRKGDFGDIILGYDTPQDYLTAANFLGASVGRYANRIRAGKFELDGKSYQLETNDGDHHLHGGLAGYDKRLWSISGSGASDDGTSAFVEMTLQSPDGDGGYPGNLDVTVRYVLDGAGALHINYTATTDQPTIVNLTNHAYFNLAGVENGHGILDHVLMIPSHHTTPVDAGLIPTGQLGGTNNTVFDFTNARRIGQDVRDMSDQQIAYGRGYDHNWVLDGATDEVDGLKIGAVLTDPMSGRQLTIKTTSPAIQFYSGNFLDGTVAGRDGIAYRQGDGLCLEPQTFPNSPNQSQFPSARLDPGQTYTNKMVFIPTIK